MARVMWHSEQTYLSCLALCCKIPVLWLCWLFLHWIPFWGAIQTWGNCRKICWSDKNGTYENCYDNNDNSNSSNTNTIIVIIIVIVIAVTHAVDSRRVWILPPFVCVSVCYFAWYLKTSAAKITELDVEVFQGESCKTIYFGFRRSNVKVISHENNTGMGLCTLVSAGFFWFVY